MKILLLVTLLLTVLAGCVLTTKNVLIVSVFSPSHVMDFLTLADSLRERGITVTLAAYDESRAPIEEKGYEFQSIGCRARIQLPHRGQALVDTMDTAISVKNMYWVFRHLYDAGFNETYQVMTNRKYDAYIVDMFNLHAMDIAHKLNLPFIIFQSGGVLYHETQSFIPRSFSANPQQQMESVWNRLYENYYQTAMFIYHLGPEIYQLNEIREKYGIAKSYGLFDRWTGRPVLCQAYFGIEYARAISPLNILLGPMVHKQTEIRPQDLALKQWLDDVETEGNHVIYIAFGTQFSINQWQAELLLEGALQDPKARVLIVIKESHRAVMGYESWKDRFSSVRVESWLNQHMVLAHSAVKVFISHGGWKSVGESILYHKPMLMLPLAIDQFGHSLRMEEVGIALKLNKKHFTAGEVFSKLNQIKSSPNFVHNTEKLHKISEWNGGATRGAQFVELFIDVGGADFLQPVDQRMSWIAVSDVDIRIVGFVALIASYLVTRKFVQCIFP